MKLFSLILTLFLMGCSSLLTSNENVQFFYVLNPIGEVVEVARPASVRLGVQRPVIPAWLDTDHIMLRRAQNQVDFYAGARWIENAGDMLGAVILQSLENNKVARDISYSGQETNTDYLLVVEVIGFQADYQSNEHPPVVEVALQVKLVSMPDNTIHSRFTIRHQVLAQKNQLRDIIKAFDAAVEESMIDLVEYTIIHLSSRERSPRSGG
jgi:cholesterol transport system auxiliary component